MRIAILVLTTLSLLALSVPAAAAEPQCLQVYPWSELCEGDVEGFLQAFGVEPVEPSCTGKDCIPPTDPPVECIQVYPWSMLCSGDVVGFTCAMVRCETLA